MWIENEQKRMVVFLINTDSAEKLTLYQNGTGTWWVPIDECPNGMVGHDITENNPLSDDELIDIYNRYFL